VSLRGSSFRDTRILARNGQTYTPCSVRDARSLVLKSCIKRCGIICQRTNRRPLAVTGVQSTRFSLPSGKKQPESTTPRGLPVRGTPGLYSKRLFLWLSGIWWQATVAPGLQIPRGFRICLIPLWLFGVVRNHQ